MTCPGQSVPLSLYAGKHSRCCCFASMPGLVARHMLHVLVCIGPGLIGSVRHSLLLFSQVLQEPEHHVTLLEGVLSCIFMRERCMSCNNSYRLYCCPFGSTLSSAGCHAA